MPLEENHVFVRPRKEIITIGDMEVWNNSEAYHEYVSFLECMNEAVKGKSLSCPKEVSPAVQRIVEVLENVNSLIDETPPIEQPQRFGNKAFATFYAKLCEKSKEFLTTALPDESLHKAIEEISIYLEESMGNSTRIDYGTGHEMSFVMFLYCLFRIGALDIESKDDKVAAVTKIFNRYMILSRRLQLFYNMEPAGSHGVWSLDDFQFVPFIWGSSQFFGNGKIEPSHFIEPNVVDRCKDEFMFLGCISYIMQVKKGPFYEHSNQLWNISGTPNWTKVNQGLIKMYKAEVLAKHPVIQHTFFGSLFSTKALDKTKLKPLVPPRGIPLRPPPPPIPTLPPPSNSGPPPP